MKITEIVKSVSSAMKADKLSSKKRIERINKLLKELEKKQDKIRKKYDSEKNPIAQKRLKTKLKIIKLQRKKCNAELVSARKASS